MSGMWGHIRYEHTALVEPGGWIFDLMVDCDQPVPLYRALSALEETFFLVFRVINMDVYCCVLYVETLFRNRECAVYSYELWSQCSHVLSSNIISFNVEIKYI